MYRLYPLISVVFVSNLDAIHDGLDPCGALAPAHAFKSCDPVSEHQCLVRTNEMQLGRFGARGQLIVLHVCMQGRPNWWENDYDLFMRSGLALNETSHTLTHLLATSTTALAHAYLRTKMAAAAASKSDDGPAVGIDLGTTNSCVSMWWNGRVEVIANDQGERLTPSVVAFTGNKILVGDAAVNQAASNPTNTIFGENHLFFVQT